MRRILLSVLVLLFTAAAGAWAQSYPNRPIRLIVAFPAGGTVDALARSVSTQLESQIGTTIVVDNRGGANGAIAADLLKNASANGYTMLFSSPSILINEIVKPRTTPYRVLRDFVPVTNICMGEGYFLVVNASVSARSVKELIALSKQKAGQVTYGTPGVGNTLQLATEVFNQRTGAKLMHVPYRGLAPAVTAILGGEINVLFAPPTVVVPHIQSGKLRALGFTGPKRWSYLPQVPTIAEQGFPGYDVRLGWQGWYVPTGTPAAIVSRVNAEIRNALAVPKVRDFIRLGGYEPVGDTPAAFREFIREEIKRYAAIVKQAGIKVQ
ncbi:MAG: tripartite tricarboxylate transporter substrate binding protein [Betaproteobacteria bacterium]|nr:tripartite tricarboxylate transporter substrate binding protein [Betaproteobacteria bacterium]MDH3435402.1 tripartite tricarboxylate transporter substrate binding protein [Betaproteobacteria bacterium]